MRDQLENWVVYDHPSDHPAKWVARRWLVTSSGVTLTDDFLEADSLEAIRAAIQDKRPGLYLFPRMSMDDPTIAEVWI